MARPKEGKTTHEIDRGLNRTEKIVLDALRTVEGATTYRHGYPDFQVEIGQFMFGIEVKRSAQSLQPHQKEMVDALERHGHHTLLVRVGSRTTTEEVRALVLRFVAELQKYEVRKWPGMRLGRKLQGRMRRQSARESGN